jgi:hypothetical protein
VCKAPPALTTQPAKCLTRLYRSLQRPQTLSLSGFDFNFEQRIALLIREEHGKTIQDALGE